MTTIREPAFAGSFYPNDAEALSKMVDSLLALAGSETHGVKPLKAIIAPHAGYVYSGKTAGKIYGELTTQKQAIKRVVLLGPSHRVAFKGVALPCSDVFRTPLGLISIDQTAMAKIQDLPWVTKRDDAHKDEHSLEVQLPFLQRTLGDFELLPIVVGDASAAQVCQLLERLWGAEETLIVISTDLSHFHNDTRARQLDDATRQKIEALNATLDGGEACGCRPVNGLLTFLKAHNLAIETVDTSNSGDTAGDKNRVVGYGAWRVRQPRTNDSLKSDSHGVDNMWSLAERQQLLHLAREAIKLPLTGETNLNVNMGLYPARLREPGACFVTLNLNGTLRGCIGSLEAHRALVLDVAHNAQAAAFKDPRFTPITTAEYQALDIHISILSQPVAMHVQSQQALISSLEPGIHGLIIEEDGKRATYLPSVWAQISEPNRFVAELRRKAGLPEKGWQATTRCYTYTTEEFS